MPPELFGMAGMCVQNIIDVTFFSLSSELSSEQCQLHGV